MNETLEQIDKHMEQARLLAAQCWCDEETSNKEMDATLAEAVARRIATWMETAAQMTKNADFYRGLLDECAKHLGEAAYTADDGTVMDEPLRLKVPELVAALTKERDEIREEIHERSNKAMRMLGEVTKERDYWRGTFHLVEKDGMRGLAEQLAAAQAEIERLKVVCSDYRRIEEEMLGTLLTTQAENVRLREALELCRKELDGLPHSLGYSFTHIPIIDKTLALPSDTTALQARLADEREKIAKFLEDDGANEVWDQYDYANAIRSMK